MNIEMFMQFKNLLGGVCLLLLVTVVQAENTDQAFCRHYARDLMSLPQQKQHALRMCQKDQSHWSADKAHHLRWCLSVSKAEANKKRYSHNKLVNLCDDTYKLIMVNRHQVANLLLSANETIKLPLAGKQLRQALLQGNSKNPYRQYYPAVSQAMKNQRLDQCDMYRLAVDIDNNRASNEWVLTVDEGCLPEMKAGHIWLLQQLKGTYYVLFEGENNAFTLRHHEHHGYKDIAISTRLRTAEENKGRCGSIQAEWRYVAGRYLPFKGEADEHGTCLPEYHLPDYLQGENTFTLSERAWKEGMNVEEKKRIALFTPYKKSLEAYIPQWIKGMEQQVPAMQDLVGTMPLVSRQQVKEDERGNKGFIQTIRDFLGLSP